MSKLEERVRELWSTNPVEQRALMRTLQAEGHKPSEILREIQVMRSGGVRQPKKGASIDPRLAGCQRNDEGQVVDPFTLKLIAPENLVGYTISEGTRFCFDRRSLYRQYVLAGYQPLQNPFTRELLPSSLHQEVIAYGESLRTALVFDHRKLVVEPFTMIGEVVVEYFTSLGSDYLKRIASTNLIYRGQSLYRERLTADAEALGDPIETRPFASLVEKSEMLVLLFEFVKELRSRPQYETIYFHLGGVLAMTPLVAKEDGFDLQLTAEMTVAEVVKEFYHALARLPVNRSVSVYRKYDIVTEYGESLSYLDLQKPISEQIPGELLHYVPFETEEEVIETVEYYSLEAFYENDRSWLEEINANADPINDYTLDYTVSDLRAKLMGRIKRGRLREDSDYWLEDLFTDLSAGRVTDSLIHPLMEHAINSNSVRNLEDLLSLFGLMHRFHHLSALWKYSLHAMKDEVREFVATRLAGPQGTQMVHNFYSETDFYTDDYQTVARLDDPEIFRDVFNLLVAGKNYNSIEVLLGYVSTVGSLKIRDVVHKEVDALYSFRLFFGTMDAETYESLLARLTQKELDKALEDMSWLEKLVGAQYFTECFKVLMGQISGEQYREANWSSCEEIFSYEGVVEKLYDPYFVLEKILEKEGADENVPYFISSLTEEQAQKVLTQHPSVYGFEEALKMGYAIILPPVGSRARAELVEGALRSRETDLLLQYLIAQREDVDLAIEIILSENMKIYRQTASYLLAGASYDDVVSLLDQYFVEQLAFGVLPLEYFRRFMRENEMEEELTPEQRELLS